MLAHEYIIRKYPNMTREEKIKLKSDCLSGIELVHDTARLCTMNMLLHGIGTDENPTVEAGKDALSEDPGDRFNLVLANPPFGKKSSTVFYADDGEIKTVKESIQRQDFWATSSNKQLNFVHWSGFSVFIDCHISKNSFSHFGNLTRIIAIGYPSLNFHSN